MAYTCGTSNCTQLRASSCSHAAYSRTPVAYTWSAWRPDVCGHIAVPAMLSDVSSVYLIVHCKGVVLYLYRNVGRLRRK